jgi:hypothetical protein
MSQKIDSTGILIGPYGLEDLETYMFPEVKRKGKRREKFRRLDYELVWDITEMQVKVHVRPLFRNQTGPRTTQLAKERRLDEDERALAGESRSKALIRDIEISMTASMGPRADGLYALEADRRWELTVDNGGPSQRQPAGELARDYQQTGRTESPRMTRPARALSQLRSRGINDLVPVSLSHILMRYTLDFYETLGVVRKHSGTCRGIVL